MWKFASVVVILASLSAAALRADGRVVPGADAQFKFATFVGTVTDSNGHRVAGAEVLITHTGNRLKRAATTGADGTYSITNVQPGTYDIRISFGSATAFERRGVTVRAGDIARVDTQLRTAGAKAGSPPAIADIRQVQVSLQTYRPDGRPDAVVAVGGADEFTSFISADAGLCTVRTGEPSPPPAVGWRISGRVVNRTDDALTVRIDWQRLWENGTRQPKPRSGTLEATIRRGERFPLDSVTSTASADCAVTGGSLEATVIARPAGVGGGGRGGGSAALPGSARTAGASADQAPDQLAEAAQRLRERAAEQYQELVRLVPGAFQVELWLVQTRPDNTEQVQLITQPLGGSTSFVFPPVRVSSEGDAAEVEVFGFLRRTQTGDGAGQLSLQVAIGRNLRQSGPRPIESYSASGKVVPWPLPAEVLSFELPVSASDQRALAGHRFDLRVRITPR
jgi:hypothetical protein